MTKRSHEPLLIPPGARKPVDMEMLRAGVTRQKIPARPQAEMHSAEDSATITAA
jgi:hypothetical protein